MKWAYRKKHLPKHVGYKQKEAEQGGKVGYKEGGTAKKKKDRDLPEGWHPPMALDAEVEKKNSHPYSWQNRGDRAWSNTHTMSQLEKLEREGL